MADVLMARAYRDCLLWAAGDPEVMAAFSRETGTVIAQRTSPLDGMIDAATGYDAHIAKKFLSWFNENIWCEAVPEGVLTNG